MEENQNSQMQQPSQVPPQGEPQRQAEPEELMAGITNIKTTETYTLPSKGLCYDPVDKIPQAITLRRMTTREDKMRMRNSTENEIRRDILQACIMNEGVNAGQLTLTDANYLLFKLRVLSLLDDTYKVQCICPHCSSQFVHQINLSEVPVKYLDEKSLSLLKLELPLSKQKIDLKYPSLNEMISTFNGLNEYFERFPNADRAEQIYTKSTTIFVDKVNGQQLMSIEVEDWLESLDIIDSRALRDVISKVETLYGYVDEIIAKCPACGKDVPHGLPITAELFTPSK